MNHEERRHHVPLFRSAITGDDGSVDPGYLGLYAIMVTILGVIPVSLLLAGMRMFLVDGHPLDLVGVAAVIGGAGAAFGTAAGGVGVFRMGDKTHGPMRQSASITNTEASPFRPASTTISTTSIPVVPTVEPRLDTPSVDDDDALIAEDAARRGRPVKD